MKLLPAEGTDAYVRPMEYGSLLKLYDYDVSSKSNIVWSGGGLRYRIEGTIPEMALPIGFFECRPRFKDSRFSASKGIAIRCRQAGADEHLQREPIHIKVSVDDKSFDVTSFVFDLKGKGKRSRLYDYRAQGVM